MSLIDFNKMKVLIIRSKSMSFNGGIKRHCEELILQINHYKDLDILPIREVLDKRIKIIRKSVFNSNDLKKYIQESNCDVVHVHGFMSIGAIQAINMAYKLRKKIVYSPHFHPFKYLQNPLIGKLAFNLLIRPILYKVDSIITINNEDTSFFKKLHKNVTRIPHWYNPSNFNEEQKISKENNFILFVGRNEANKGLEHLYQLPPKYEVHCVTKGPLLRNDFVLHENVSEQELNMLYNKASVVVVPSRYEAFSLVALEALSHHTPIVISDRVRIGDYLKGNKGYKIFKYHDYQSFNKAIEEVLLQENIDFKKLLLPFDINEIREKYYKVYSKYKVSE